LSLYLKQKWQLSEVYINQGRHTTDELESEIGRALTVEEMADIYPLFCFARPRGNTRAGAKLKQPVAPWLPHGG